MINNHRRIWGQNVIGGLLTQRYGRHETAGEECRRAMCVNRGEHEVGKKIVILTKTYKKLSRW
jgi:hypothetical protein